MTLTTHAIIGAAAASLFPSHPVLAFAAGFASHFAADSFPHWDYRLLSKVENKENKLLEDMSGGRLLMLDVMRAGSDAALGVIVSVAIFSFWLFHLPIWFTAMGAIAGILPDPLQFVYFKTRLALMTPLQRFHIWVQKGKSIYPGAFWGLMLQATLVAAVLALLKLRG